MIAQIGFSSDPICGLTYARSRLGQTPGGGTNIGVLEYDVKAALLYRCLELVQWPSRLSPAANPAITVGVLGKNPFGESLKCLAGKTISGRRVVIKKLGRVSQAEHCQLVFVASSETNRASKILKSLAGFPVLTVGESPGFAEQGGMINLLLAGKNIRLEINPAAAEKAGILMDPKLISMRANVPEPALAPSSSSGS